MKIAPFFLAASLLLLAGCADTSATTKKDDRLGGSVGVVVTSHDMSHVVPTRPDAVPPAN